MRRGGISVIRQAICCDICGAEKKQTNHWFMAYDQNGELRVSGWNSRNRLQPGSKHLCGQACLHKLVDEFMARTLVARLQPSVAEDAEVDESIAGSDDSLPANAADLDSEPSARMVAPLAPVAPKLPPLRPQAELVAMPERVQAGEPALAPDEPPRYASRNWRAEAWDRERERSLRAMERRPGIIARRRSGS